MVKGRPKRRTDNSKMNDVSTLDLEECSKGPKDSRMEPAIMTNGYASKRTDKNGIGPSRRKEAKITNYFSPSIKSPSVVEEENELNCTSTSLDDTTDTARIERLNGCPSNIRPSSAPNTPTKPYMNGHSNGFIGRTVCTRSRTIMNELNNCSLDCNVSKPIPVIDITEVVEKLNGMPSTPPPRSPRLDENSPQTGPTTPHKIQAPHEDRLRLDSPLSPSSALSQLKLSQLTPNKLTVNKNTRVKPKVPIGSTLNTKENSNTVKPKLHRSAKTNNIITNGDAKPASRNTQMTQYFPIRRSERKPKTTLIQEKQMEIESKILNINEKGLRIKHFGNKGRGIVTTRKYSKGEFVVEYIGELVDPKEAKARELVYAQDSSMGCYMYYFSYQGTQYCIDATLESPYLGRLVNHSRNGNLVTKTVEVEGKPHLVLLAKRDLECDTELLYDYGDRSKESLEHHPWLAL